MSPFVGRAHLEAALEVWRYCFESARFVFGDALGDPDADEILKFLREAQRRVTRTEINDHLGHHLEAHRLGRALGRLVQYRLADRVKEPPPDGRGRPTEWWWAVMPQGDAHA
jgi:hypothetical protein